MIVMIKRLGLHDYEIKKQQKVLETCQKHNSDIAIYDIDKNQHISLTYIIHLYALEMCCYLLY